MSILENVSYNSEQSIIRVVVSCILSWIKIIKSLFQSPSSEVNILSASQEITLRRRFNDVLSRAGYGELNILRNTFHRTSYYEVILNGTGVARTS
jgi:hypothetical protein